MFVTVKFNSESNQSYTYTADFDVSVGDKVVVDVRGDQKIVTVSSVDVPEPSFPCKPILGFAPEKEVEGE
jgi:hypothetical protein